MYTSHENSPRLPAIVILNTEMAEKRFFIHAFLNFLLSVRGNVERERMKC